MGRFALILAVFLGLWACSGKNRTPISVPAISEDFYESALVELNQAIKKNPDNNDLVEQKLYYCEQLNWPTSCESALDKQQAVHGMSYQLVERYIAYYLRHERYQLILSTIENWNEKYQLEEKFIDTYILSLARSGRSREVVVTLREYLKTRTSASDLAFAAEQYLTIGNRPLAILTLNKLCEQAPDHPLIWNYGQLLFEMGLEDRGQEVLGRFITLRGREPQEVFSFAHLLKDAGLFAEARAILNPIFEVDSITYLYAELYEEDRMLDSAIYALQAYRSIDSTSREPVWRLGLLNEKRGRLSVAAYYFSSLMALNSEDTLAAQKLNEVQRKIAYLQRQKAAQDQLSLPDLKPKKIRNE